MDSKNAKFREYLAKKSELITAFRLPSEAFKTSSNTEVSADVLILRKSSNGDELKNWINTKEYSYSQQNFFDLPWGGGENFRAEITCNEYWIDELVDRASDNCFYPHKLLGLPTVNKLYGHGLSCSDNKGSYNFLKKIKKVPVPTLFNKEEIKKDEVILIPQELQSAKLNSFVIFNNEVYVEIRMS